MKAARPTWDEVRAALAVLNAIGVRLKLLDAQALAFIDYERRAAKIGHIEALDEIIQDHPQIAEKKNFADLTDDPDIRRPRTRANQLRQRIKIDPVLDD